MGGGNRKWPHVGGILRDGGSKLGGEQRVDPLHTEPKKEGEWERA